MDDLIDRQALIGVFAGLVPYAIDGPEDDAYARGLDAGYQAVLDAPAVDAEPVKRGKWKGYLIPHWTKRYDDDGEPEYKYHTEYVCNICGYNSIIKHNYCPHCGAKMEAEG